MYSSDNSQRLTGVYQYDPNMKKRYIAVRLIKFFRGSIIIKCTSFKYNTINDRTMKILRLNIPAHFPWWGVKRRPETSVLTEVVLRRLPERTTVMQAVDAAEWRGVVVEAHRQGRRHTT